MFRNIFMGCALVCCGLSLSAQSVSEGLLYGMDQSYGTARYRGLSGAFGALGGDLSAMGVNPAGSTVFANHYASFSAAFDYNNNESLYENTLTGADDLDLSINQVGAVFVFEDSSAPLNKFSIGLNYDSTRNFSDERHLRGVSDTSISQYFVANANSVPLIDLILLPEDFVSDRFIALGETPGFGLPAQIGFLGLNSDLITPLDSADDNIEYLSNTGTGNFNQTQRILSDGYNGKFTINGAIELHERFSFGLNLNIHSLRRDRLTDFSESNSNTDAFIQDVRYRDSVTSEGSGFSLNLGTLIKITNSLRVGLAYQSPTWYSIEDSQSLRIRTDDGVEAVTIAPDVLTLYPAYNLRIPGNWTGSLAYVFGSKGLISFDVESKDYSKLQFEQNTDALFTLNNQFIDDNLQNALTYRLGAEYRIKNFSLRGGYMMSESPYENEDFMSELTGYSLGLGYNLGRTVFDISYATSERDYASQLFNSDFLGTSTVTNRFTNVVFTVGFNF
ncbi:MAG: outer membrane protein transport protein [Nonlabens sp.]